MKIRILTTKAGPSPEMMELLNSYAALFSSKTKVSVGPFCIKKESKWIKFLRDGKFE